MGPGPHAPARMPRPDARLPLPAAAVHEPAAPAAPAAPVADQHAELPAVLPHLLRVLRMKHRFAGAPFHPSVAFVGVGCSFDPRTTLSAGRKGDVKN